MTPTSPPNKEVALANMNADDWHLFLCQHCDNRATSPNGLSTAALKIADAIDAARAATPAAGMREALEQAKAALIKIRTCSIAGCEEGYGKPEKWADDLFRSHGDVAAALKTIDAALQSVQPPAGEGVSLLALAETIHNARWPADRTLSITPFADEDQNGREYCFRIARAVLAFLPPVSGDGRVHLTTEQSSTPIGHQK